jgi:hypothetical protein
MALSPQLAQFKSSGIYRLEFDKSQTANVPAEQIRLVVGYSKKGPFNTPIFVPDTGFFEQVFGPIDRGLERKGSYFHRTSQAALERGPIIVLNLLRLNNDTSSANVDKVEYQVMSTNVSQPNPPEKEALYSGFYNKDRFWYPEDKAFLNNITTNKGLLQFVNLKQSQVTILARYIQDTRGYDVTAKEWYGVGNVPEFMNENDYISDYMIEVTLIDGDFTDYQKLAIDPVFGKYFDANKGIIKSQLNNFLAAKEVSVLAKYVGTLIPDFVDLNGNNLFIQDLVNFDTAVTGVFCAIDKKLFDDEYLSGTETGIDIIGHNLEYKTNNDPTFNKINFLSYDRVIKDDLGYAPDVSPEIPILVNSSEDISFYLTSNIGGISQVPPVVSSADVAGPGTGAVNYVIKIGVNTHSQFLTSLDKKLFNNVPGGTGRQVGSYVLMTNGIDYKWAPVVSLAEASGYVSIGLSVETVNYEVFLDGTDNIYFVSTPNWLDYDGFNGNFKSSKFNTLYKDYADGIITSGDKIWDATETAPYFAKLTQFNYGNGVGEGFITDNASGVGFGSAIMGPTSYGVPTVLVEGYEEDTFLTVALLPDAIAGNYLDSNEAATTTGVLLIQSLAGKLNKTMLINTAATLPANEVLVSFNDYKSAVAVGDYLVAEEIGPNGESRLTKIIKISNEGNYMHIYTITAIKKTTLPSTEVSVERYRKIESVIEHYKFFALKGFELDPLYHMPNGTQDRINDIYYDTMNPSTNLFNALIDKDVITYRYVIDSFGLGIQPESKNQLAYLSKARQNTLSILNAPSMEDFKASTDPKFVDVTGSLSARFISEGGDLSQNPSFVYSLPSIENGANYCGFYTPYLVIRDRGKNITVPPSGYVSNNFVDKYSTALPWSIVAGPRRGVVGGKGVVGLEVNFNKDDRDYLEPFGLNPIIFQRGVGLMISGNKTAQQNIKSALSSLHVREVLIYIQDGIAEILKLYQWEFNTVQTRLEIKTLADKFLGNVQADNGVYDFKNIMDSSNNTSDVIDANMGVLDTFVEPVKGLEILVHRTTILKTGAISTGQFR